MPKKSAAQLQREIDAALTQRRRRRVIAPDDISIALVREGLDVDLTPSGILTVRVPVLEKDDPIEDLPRICVTVLKSGAVQLAQYDSMTDTEPRRAELPAEPAPTVADVVAVVKKWFAWW